jgi:hypothetical protein
MAANLPSEPPLIERARRAGWALLITSAGAAIAARQGWAGDWATALAIGCGLIGALSIVNVILIRSLYRQIAGASRPADDRPDA